MTITWKCGLIQNALRCASSLKSSSAPRNSINPKTGAPGFDYDRDLKTVESATAIASSSFLTSDPWSSASSPYRRRAMRLGLILRFILK